MIYETELTARKQIYDFSRSKILTNDFTTKSMFKENRVFEQFSLLEKM